MAGSFVTGGVRHDDRNGEWPDLDAIWRFACDRGRVADDARMLQWLGSEPNAEHVTVGLRAIGQTPDALAARYDVDAAERRFRSEIAAIGDVAQHRRAVQPGIEQPQSRRSRTRHGVAAWWPRRAAVAAAVLALCLWGVWHLTPFGESRHAALTVVSTQAGEVRRLALPDGSRIVLGPETTVRYQSGVTRRRREVWLEGEAHFVVAPAVGRRLRVYAAHGTADDIGTTFMMRAYRTDSVVRVVVLEGAVVLRARGDIQTRATLPRVLRAGELGQLARDGEIRGERVSPDLYAAWMHDSLAFKDTPLRDVATQLTRWYAVDIAVDSTLATRTLTGSFSRKSLLAILDAVAAATDSRHDWRGGRVVFSSR